VLLMWLYFSAAVLLLGAEFSAARARMHDPRGPGGVQSGGRVPPGSRAKIGSMLAGSTRVGMPAAPVTSATSGDAAPRPVAPPAAATDAGALGPRPDKASAVARAVALSRTIARAESTATRATAVAMVGAGRKASHANAAVKRHPWRAVFVAASAGMAVALLSKHDTSRRD